MKRHLLFYTFLALLGWCVCPQGWAYDVEVNGIYYNLSGTNAIVTYPGETAPAAAGDNSYTGDIVIPATIESGGSTYNVTQIAENAFRYATITSVTFSEGLQVINTHAFDHCTNLTSVEIPNTVTNVNYEAFAACHKLLSITFGSGTTTIGQGVCYDQQNIQDVYVKTKTVPSIGPYAFVWKGATIHVYADMVYKFRTTTGWNDGFYTFVGDLEKDYTYEELQAKIAELSALSSYVKKDPGYYTVESYAGIQTAIGNCAGITATSPASTINNAMKSLINAFDALAINEITEGYYYIVCDNAKIAANGKAEKALYIDTEKNELWWGELKTDDLKYVFKLSKKASTDTWYLQNVANGLYAGAALEFCGRTSATAEPEYPVTFFLDGEGSYRMKANNWTYCPQGNPGGNSAGPSYVWGYNATGIHGEASYTLRTVPESDLADLLYLNPAKAAIESAVTPADHHDNTGTRSFLLGNEKTSADGLATSKEAISALQAAYDALSGAIESGKSLIECEEEISALEAAKAVVDAKSNPLVDGYYYLIGEYGDDTNDVPGGFAIQYGAYASNAMSATKKPFKATEKAQMFNVEYDKENGKIYLQNVASGYYLGAVKNSKWEFVAEKTALNIVTGENYNWYRSPEAAVAARSCSFVLTDDNATGISSTTTAGSRLNPVSNVTTGSNAWTFSWAFRPVEERALAYNTPQVVEMTEAGQLETLLSAKVDPTYFSTLVVKGDINATDIGYIRTLTNEYELISVDLSQANIVAGGSYTVDDVDKDVTTTANVLPNAMFGKCANLQEAKLPESATSAGDRLFSNSKKIKEVVIPDNITSIGKDLVSYTNVETVILGENVTSVGQGFAFSTGNKLTKMVFKSRDIVPSVVNSYVTTSNNTVAHVYPNMLSKFKNSTWGGKLYEDRTIQFVGDLEETTNIEEAQQAKAAFVEKLATCSSEKADIEANATAFDAAKVAAFTAAYDEIAAYNNDKLYNAGSYSLFESLITKAFGVVFCDPVRVSADNIKPGHAYLIEAANIADLKGYYLKGQPDVATKGTTAYIYSEGINDNSYWQFVPSGKTDANYGGVQTYYLKMNTMDYYLGYNNGSSNDGRSLAPTTKTAYDFAVINVDAAAIPAKANQGFDYQSVVFYNTEKNMSLGASTTLTNTMVWQWSPTQNKSYHPWNLYDATPITNAEEAKTALAEIIAEYTELTNEPGRYSATAEFTAAIDNAKTLISADETTMTQSYLAIKAIKEAYESINATDIVPITPGYYYIVTAGKGNGSSGGPYNYENRSALYNNDGIVKWMPFNPNNHAFIYYISESGSNWNVYSISDKTYIKRGKSSYNCEVETSDEPTNAQTFIAMEPGSGKFAMKGSTYVYAMNASHNGTNNATGNLNVWGTDGEAKNYGINQWFLHKVPQDILDELTNIVVENGVATVISEGILTEELYLAALKGIDKTAVRSVNLESVDVAMYPTQVTNPFENTNTMFYMADDYAHPNEGINLVTEGKCPSLILVDKEDFVPAKAFEAKNATYLKAGSLDTEGWYSAVLPFDYVVDANLEVLDSAVVKDATIAFSAVEAGETIPAGTPFIYKSKVEGPFSILQINVNCSVAANATPSTSGALKGTYVKIPAGKATGKYILDKTGSAFAKATVNASIPAFRAYIDGVAGSKVYTIVIDDELTGVTDASADLTAKVDVYTTDGRLVRKGVSAVTALQGLGSGIYVVNGKTIKK